MPNLCWNVLRVSGDEREVEEFEKLARLEEMDISLNQIVPVPDEIKTTGEGKENNQEIIKKYGASDSYEWRIKNWGTSGDAIWTCEAGFTKKDGMLTYYFDTAESPPIEWLKLASKKFPHLVFLMKFVEQCYYFMGIAMAIDGEVMHRGVELEGIDNLPSQNWEPVPKGYKPKQPNTDRLSNFGF